MSIEILVDAEEFWPRMEADIRGAVERVYVHTLSFEGDRVGKALAQVLVESTAPDRRVIADEFYTFHRINDLYLHNPKHWLNAAVREERRATLRMMAELEAKGVPVRLANPSGPLNLRGFERNHKKMLVVDDHVSYIGGVNYSEHNFLWHDMMVRIDDPDISAFLADDFVATWSGKSLSTSQRFRALDLYLLDARNNRRSFEPVLHLIRSARRSVYIESPYVTYPFFEPLRQAHRNGAKVTLVTPELNNWHAVKEYSLWESIRAGFDVRLYQERMMHLKAMLIDGQYLVVGSSNFDFLSVGSLQEIIAVITDKDAIAQFERRVVERDLAVSLPATSTIPHWKGLYHLACFKAVSAFIRFMSFVLRSGR